jgi:hypothetical protein
VATSDSHRTRIGADGFWYHENRIYKDLNYEDTHDISVLLVMTKYLDLVRRALDSSEPGLRVPILATAHDFDILGRFEPHGG